MKRKFFTALIALLIMSVQVEAAETFGVMDIISRIVVTTLGNEIVQTFPNARHELLAELEELLFSSKS